MADSASALGFRMPAEWAPHDATWIGWPHNASDWPGKLAPVVWAYAEIVRKLAPGEVVRILVNSAAQDRGVSARPHRPGPERGARPPRAGGRASRFPRRDQRTVAREGHRRRRHARPRGRCVPLRRPAYGRVVP